MIGVRQVPHEVRTQHTDRILDSSELRQDSYLDSMSRKEQIYQEPHANQLLVSQQKLNTMTSQSKAFFNPANKDNVMLEKIFDQLDVNGRGRIRSYEVYLCNLKADQKNLIHEILEGVDEDGMFQSMDFDTF